MAPIKNLFDKAKNGDTFAQEDLGLAYCEGGDFLPKDIDKAIYWLSSAVEFSHSWKTWGSARFKRNTAIPTKGFRDVQQGRETGVHKFANQSCRNVSMWS